MIDRAVEEWLRRGAVLAAAQAKRDAEIRRLVLDAYKPHRRPLVMGGSW